jgi:hypothetical protein
VAVLHLEPADWRLGFYDSVNVATGEVSQYQLAPCTGAPMEVTLNAQIFVHEGHPNNFVARVRRTGSTDEGYTMVHGNDMFTENNSGFMFRSPTNETERKSWRLWARRE